MKQILKSLFTIIAVAAIAGSATWAYFTDSTSVHATAGAGTLDIDYRGNMSDGHGSGGTITLSNMVPGVWQGTTSPYAYFLSLQNLTPSTIAAKYRFRESLISQTETGFYNYLNVKVYRNEGGSHVVKYSGPLSGMLVDPALVSEMGNLPVGSGHDWHFEFQLDPSTPNQYQGDSATFDINVDAIQSDAPVGVWS